MHEPELKTTSILPPLSFGAFCHVHVIQDIFCAMSVRARSSVMLQVIVTDTAGMRQTLDPIEAEGVAVAHDTAQQADVVLSVRDCVTWLDSRASSPSDFSTQGPASQNFHAIRQHQNVVTVLNKADELTQPQLQLLHLSDDQSGKEQHSQPQQQQQNGAQLSIVHHSHLQQQQNGVEQSNLKQKNVQQVAQQAPLQQHAEWQSQQQGPEQQQQQISQHSGSPSVLSLTKVHPEEEASSRAMGPDQVQSVHSTQTVLCSCKTGWNMDAMAGLLEQSVQGIMQSGQKSEEALVITRYSPAIDAAHRRWWGFVDCQGDRMLSAMLHGRACLVDDKPVSEQMTLV